MEILGFTLSQGQLWLLGIPAWVISVWVSFVVGLKHASANRHAAAAAAFRQAVNEASSSLPMENNYSVLTGESLPSWDKPIRQLLQTLNLAYMNYMPYLKKNRQDKLERDWQKVIVYCERGIPNVMGTGDIHYASADGERFARANLLQLLSALAQNAKAT